MSRVDSSANEIREQGGHVGGVRDWWSSVAECLSSAAGVVDEVFGVPGSGGR
jgi:hypothetical protein